MWAAHLSSYLQPSGFGLVTSYIDVWEHFGGDRHFDVDWSPIIEDLYSPELGSACVEVVTTLHGSASSLYRRVEGCVPSEGLRPPRCYPTVGQTSGLYYPPSPHVQYRPWAPHQHERPYVSYFATTQPCYATRFVARPMTSYPKPKAQHTSTPFTLRT
ncbi:hypothetical protein AAG906_008865 [Vitis piasezkii]